MDYRGPLLARAFVQAADTLSDGFDLPAYLKDLCSHYVDLLDVDAAEILLGDNADSLRLEATTSHALRAGVDLPARYDHDGPARQAIVTGEQVAVSDLRMAGPRWPRFAHATVRAGYAGAHIFPMRLRMQVVGAVTVFRVRPGALPPDQVTIAQALTDAVTIGLVQQRVRHEQSALVEQLQGALNSRVIIEQAKGILAERCGVHVDKAFELMRAFARPRRLKLSELAASIVRGGRDTAALAEPARSGSGSGNDGSSNGNGSVSGNGSSASGHRNSNGNGHVRSDGRRLLTLRMPAGTRDGRTGAPGGAPGGGT
jgi:hypothetical protein